MEKEVGVAAREVILKFATEEDRSFVVLTAFLAEEIQQAIDMIVSEPGDMPENEQILRILEEQGYIKVISMGPEIMEIW